MKKNWSSRENSCSHPSSYRFSSQSKKPFLHMAVGYPELTNCQSLSMILWNLSLHEFCNKIVIYCAVGCSFRRSWHCTHCDSERSVSRCSTTFLWMCVPVHPGTHCNLQYCSGHHTQPSLRGWGTLRP